MKIAILGSRDYLHLHKVKHYVSTIPAGTTVVSGGFRGVDECAATTARRRGLPVMVFNANWKRYGKTAGVRHMQDILGAAERVVIYWDGKSRGSKILIAMAKKMGKPLQIIR